MSTPFMLACVTLLLLPTLSLCATCGCKNSTSAAMPPAIPLDQISNPLYSNPYLGVAPTSCGTSFTYQVPNFSATHYPTSTAAYADCSALCTANSSCVAFLAKVNSAGRVSGVGFGTYKCQLYFTQYCFKAVNSTCKTGGGVQYCSALFPRASVPAPIVTACGASQGCTFAGPSYDPASSVPTAGIPAFGLIDPDALISDASPLSGTSCDLDGLPSSTGVIRGLIKTSLAFSSFPGTPQDCAQQVLSTNGGQFFSWVPITICSGTCYIYLASAFPYGAASGAVSSPPFDPTAPAFTGQLPTGF